MDTTAIRYRVADFLKNHPPFHAMEQDDLLEFAQTGRVKFFEPNEYVLSQGASRFQVFVIQQGTVSLWDERGQEPKLLDVRGVGDMLGVDQFHEVRTYPYSATAASDVLVYAFPSEEFTACVLKYPYASRYIAAHGSVTADSRAPQERRDPQSICLHELPVRQEVITCDAGTSIRKAAEQMLSTESEAIVVLDSENRTRGILTARSFLEWIAEGGADSARPAATLLNGYASAISPDASVSDGVLALGASDGPALALTTDGEINGRVQAIVTSKDLGRVFGDRPVEILQEIRQTRDVQTLRNLNERARAFALQYLTSAASAEWLARFTSSVDASIVRRIISLTSVEDVRACWCFCGSSGRGESLTRLAPQIVMITEDDQPPSVALEAYRRTTDALIECNYLDNADGPFESSFYAASLADWKGRYSDWVSDPILKEIYRARPMFDLRPIQGRKHLWQELEGAITPSIDGQFLHVLANDCLASLPPLTFFKDAVLDESGEEAAVFRLEHSALRPLVDVGRVFGMASRRVFASSTLERFAMACRLLSKHASIFHEASETFRIVLWQQARVGISQGSSGDEVPPALLDRYDQQVLKTGFRSISRLLEFTADLEWLKAL